MASTVEKKYGAYNVILFRDSCGTKVGLLRLNYIKKKNIVCFPLRTQFARQLHFLSHVIGLASSMKQCAPAALIKGWWRRKRGDFKIDANCKIMVEKCAALKCSRTFSSAAASGARCRTLSKETAATWGVADGGQFTMAICDHAFSMGISFCTTWARCWVDDCGWCGDEGRRGTHAASLVQWWRQSICFLFWIRLRWTLIWIYCD